MFGSTCLPAAWLWDMTENIAWIATCEQCQLAQRATSKRHRLTPSTLKDA